MLRLLNSLIWLLGALLFYGVAAVPAWYLYRWGMNLPFPWFLFFVPLTLFVFIVTLLLFVGIVKRLFVPKPKEGTFAYPHSREANIWRLNVMVSQYVMVPFHRLIFLNATLRYITLRLFGAKLDYSTTISTATHLRDYDFMDFGKKLIFGGWAMLHGHHFLPDGRIMFKTLRVGSKTFVGAKSGIACGVAIGSRVFIGGGNDIGLNTRISDRCKVHYKTKIGSNCFLEEKVTLGKNCIIGNDVQIREAIEIYDFTEIPDGTIVETQEQADSFTLPFVEKKRSFKDKNI